MDNSPNLLLPYILPSQAQKHVTHNDAIRALDAVVQIAVVSDDLTVPPPEPAHGARYIVGEPAGGDWAGEEGAIAAWQDGGWSFYEPRLGWLAWCIAREELLVFADGGWEAAGAGGGIPDSVDELGINTDADGTNRLSVQAEATLLSHDGGSHRLIVNKETVTDNGSLIFQTGFSGRGEIGLTGNDDIHVRVSSDGATFLDAMQIDHATGIVTFPRTNVLTDFAVNLFQDSGRFAGNAITAISVGAFAFPSYFSTVNSTAVAGLGKFIFNNNDYGGSAGALNASVKDLIDLIRDSGYRRYNVEFWVAQITQGSGTAGAVTHAGQTYYESLYSAQRVRLPNMTFHAYVRAIDNTILINQLPGLSLYVNGMAQSSVALITPAQGWVSLTIYDRLNPRQSYGYTPSTFDVYCRTSGNRWQLACPALLPGITRIDDNVGAMPAYNVWGG